jgi:hypothetical protein
MADLLLDITFKEDGVIRSESSNLSG